MNTHLAKILTGREIPDRYLITGDEPAYVWRWEWETNTKWDCGYIWTGMDFNSRQEAERWVEEQEQMS